MSEKLSLYDLVKETRQDVKDLHEKVNDFNILVVQNSGKIKNLKEHVEKKSSRTFAFLLALPTTILTILNIIILITTLRYIK